MNNQSELMRQHHAVRTGVSIGKEFTELERSNHIIEQNRLRELRIKYSIEGYPRPVNREHWFGVVVTDFEPCVKIYPAPIKPIEQPHDGVETIASVFGRKEKCYLPHKNIAL